jgi:hypothetical protein
MTDGHDLTPTQTFVINNDFDWDTWDASVGQLTGLMS